VNARLSEAAANTTIDPASVVVWDGGGDGAFWLHPARQAISIVDTKAARTPIRRMRKT
jgi:hypothetical protein